MFENGAWKAQFEAPQQAQDGRKQVVDYKALGHDALLSVTTAEHYLPLLYVIATQQPDDEVTYPVEVGDRGSISMLSVRVG